MSKANINCLISMIQKLFYFVLIIVKLLAQGLPNMAKHQNFKLAKKIAI